MSIREFDRYSDRYFHQALERGQEIRFWKAVASRKKMSDRFVEWCELESGLAEHLMVPWERDLGATQGEK